MHRSEWEMSLKLEQLSAKCKQQAGDVPLSASIHCERKFIISTLAENVLGSLVPDAACVCIRSGHAPLNSSMRT